MLSSLICLAAVAAVPSQVTAEEDFTSSLLVPVTSFSSPGIDAGIATELQRRLVLLDTDLLLPLVEGGASSIKIELFSGEILTADLIERSPALGGYIWHGQVAGEDEDSDVVLSVVGESMTASIRTQDRLFRIAPAEDGPVHYLAQLDEKEFGGCATSAAHEVFGADFKGGANGNRNPIVDVMVVYTAAARSGQGGTNAMSSLINLAVTETNQGYDKSDVTQQLALVHTYEIVNYNENGNFSTELSRLRAKNDGHFDEIHGMRDQYGADAVAMIVNSSQYCGIAYLMTNPSHGFESNAFSVTARTCATGYYSFGHELGHNFGSTHDHQNASSGAYNYSFGWRTSNNAYRTIMAYSPGTRIKYFSNHNKNKNGMPLGQQNYAENWRSLNNTASIVAGWRDSAATYDLTMTLSALNSGSSATATITGSLFGKVIYLYNGSGHGSTTIPSLGIDQEIANANKVAQKNANTSGFAIISKSLPPSLAGLTVYLQAADTDGKMSAVHVDTIL
ncbi:MAG: hypothetical protein H8E15_14115 [Planctomycetes bacterium]|nr:hypothetical protein [Planctomycetota bacterium]